MKKLGLLAFSFLMIGCGSGTDEGKSENDSLKVVELDNDSKYTFKKIYVEDKLGRTHEILTATSGSTMGGVSLLELCVYENGKTEGTNREPSGK